MAYYADDGAAFVSDLRAPQLPDWLLRHALHGVDRHWPSGPTSFDPTSEEMDHDLTIVVSDAQESFGTASWCITVAITLLGGVLAYFVSGCALKPLRSFAAQVENVCPDNLADMKISEDVPLELARCSASFNDMIDRLDEGFAAQRQFTGNAAHELRTPLALMQAQIELFCSEHPDAQPKPACLACCRSRPNACLR